MGDAGRGRCPNCARLEERVAALEALVAAQAKRIADLETQLAKSKRNSSNSSKPPSSDIVKPPKPAPPQGESRRKTGGQPGHPRHERSRFPPEQVDEVRTYKMTARAFRRALRAAKRAALKAATRRVPAHPDARTLAKRMREHGEAYFTFVTTPGVEPTNNVAEQVIRFVVIDRRITQGTRGERGRKWCERIWTVIATCAQQGRSVYRFLVDAVRAHFAGDPAPSLLPNPP